MSFLPVKVGADQPLEPINRGRCFPLSPGTFLKDFNNAQSANTNTSEYKK